MPEMQTCKMTVAKPLFNKLISETLVLVAKAFTAFQYSVDNVKGTKFHAPTEVGI